VEEDLVSGNNYFTLTKTTYLNIDRLETSSKASEKIREALKQIAA
jgi:hypothetical protein